MKIDNSQSEKKPPNIGISNGKTNRYKKMWHAYQ